MRGATGVTPLSAVGKPFRSDAKAYRDSRSVRVSCERLPASIDGSGSLRGLLTVDSFSSRHLENNYH